MAKRGYRSELENSGASWGDGLSLQYLQTLCPDLSHWSRQCSCRKGDQKDIQRAGSFLGQGIASMLHLFNPSIIVLGGGVTKAGDLFLKPFRQSLESEVISPAASSF